MDTGRTVIHFFLTTKIMKWVSFNCVFSLPILINILECETPVHFQGCRKELLENPYAPRARTSLAQLGGSKSLSRAPTKEGEPPTLKINISVFSNWRFEGRIPSLRLISAQILDADGRGQPLPTPLGNCIPQTPANDFWNARR